MVIAYLNAVTELMAPLFFLQSYYLVMQRIMLHLR